MSIARITEILETYSTGSPVIYNVTMTVADTQYSQVLPAGTKKISFSVQSGVSTDNYRLAYVTGKVATPTAPYLKYGCDVEYSQDGINLDSGTLYFACSAALKVAQIIVWL